MKEGCMTSYPLPLFQDILLAIQKRQSIRVKLKEILNIDILAWQSHHCTCFTVF